MAGEVRIQTFVQLIKFGAYIQFSVPNPPLLLAANRQTVKKLSCINQTFRYLPEKNFIQATLRGSFLVYSQPAVMPHCKKTANRTF